MAEETPIFDYRGQVRGRLPAARDFRIQNHHYAAA